MMRQSTSKKEQALNRKFRGGVDPLLAGGGVVLRRDNEDSASSRAGDVESLIADLPDARPACRIEGGESRVASGVHVFPGNKTSCRISTQWSLRLPELTAWTTTMERGR